MMPEAWYQLNRGVVMPRGKNIIHTLDIIWATGGIAAGSDASVNVNIGLMYFMSWGSRRDLRLWIEDQCWDELLMFAALLHAIGEDAVQRKTPDLTSGRSNFMALLKPPQWALSA